MSAISSGYSIDFRNDSIGGLRLVRLAAFEDVEYIEDLGEVVNLGLKNDKQFYTFQLYKNVSSFTTGPNKDKKKGLVPYNESLNLIFNKMKKESSALVSQLLKSSVIAIVEDKTGNFILLGRDGGLRVDNTTAGSGTSSGDRNGYEVRLTGTAKKISHVWQQFITDAFYPDQYTRIFENQFATQFE